MNNLEAQDAARLRWVGDNLSLGRTRPATIHLVDEGGRSLYLSLAEVFARAGEIGIYGLGRITSGAYFALKQGALCPVDAEAFREWLNARQ